LSIYSILYYIIRRNLRLAVFSASLIDSKRMHDYCIVYFCWNRWQRIRPPLETLAGRFAPPCRVVPRWLQWCLWVLVSGLYSFLLVHWWKQNTSKRIITNDGFLLPNQRASLWIARIINTIKYVFAFRVTSGFVTPITFRSIFFLCSTVFGVFCASGRKHGVKFKCWVSLLSLRALDNRGFLNRLTYFFVLFNCRWYFLRLWAEAMGHTSKVCWASLTWRMGICSTILLFFSHGRFGNWVIVQGFVGILSLWVNQSFLNLLLLRFQSRVEFFWLFPTSWGLCNRSFVELIWFLPDILARGGL